jgi:excisionase family DNA binding protein
MTYPEEPVKPDETDYADRVTDEPLAPPGPGQFPPVLTAATAAELLQVHVEYLRKMVREGRVPAHRFPGGRELRFLRDELIDWLGTLPGPRPGISDPAVADPTATPHR